jgi:hypothetical protein
MNDNELNSYLNDHLAGATAAIRLLTRLKRTGGKDASFYDRLRRDIEADQAVLKGLIRRVGKRDRMRQAVASLAEKVAGVKWKIAGLEKGSLGVFEAVELLILGVHGKEMLWSTLEILPPRVAWEQIDFGYLRRRAALQRRKLEAWRTVTLDAVMR